MPQVFRTAPAQPPAEGASLVIHCSDPRFQTHCQEFLRDGLGLDHYALIAVPGGVQFLTLAEYLPKFSWVGWRWLKFIMGLTKPRRIILIAHEDCRWYLDLRFWSQPAGLRSRQEADLRQVRQTLQERFPAAKVEFYYARLENGSVTFDSF
jgi:hypothetical protein